MQTENEEKIKRDIVDVSHIYKNRKKAFKPMAYVLAVCIFIGILMPLVLFVIGKEAWVKNTLLITFFPIVLSILPIYYMGKCPNCGKYMGRFPKEYCKACGAKVLEDDEDIKK